MAPGAKRDGTYFGRPDRLGIRRVPRLRPMASFTRDAFVLAFAARSDDVVVTHCTFRLSGESQRAQPVIVERSGTIVAVKPESLRDDGAAQEQENGNRCKEYRCKEDEVPRLGHPP